MIRTIIIEDEIPNVVLLKQFLESYTEGVEVIGEAGSIVDGIELINNTKPDLLFLDIELSDGNSFEILKQFEKRSFLIVFLTGYKKYALEAIKIGAFDYLLKPLIIADLVDVVNRIRERVEEKRLIQGLVENSKKTIRESKKIIIKSGTDVKLINLEDIEYIESYGNYSKLNLTDNTRFLSNDGLSKYDGVLSKCFYRIHKSYIVNINKIKEFKAGRTVTLILDSDVRLSLSSRRKKEFYEYLEVHFSK